MSNSTDNSMKTALVFGATGAVGKQLLMDVLKTGTYSKVITMGRREVKLDDSIPQDKLVQKVIDFDNLEASRDDFRGVNDVFCCLGATRKDAGSAENYVKIDKTYVLNLAKMVAEENKSRTSDSTLSPVHLVHCSSSGVSTTSMVLLLRTKAETEEGLKEIGFQKLTIIRPSLLEPVEPRPYKRFLETIGNAILPPISHFFNLHQTISVRDVGKAMHRIAQDSSFRPSAPDGVFTSNIGTDVQVVYTIDMENILSSDKK
ncbi:hypothetical protein BDB01DRAFT_854631 [Pilobolus umbonatus]|nr:hypothetical protein BDB01DRAFT_854631 [Pilobolus umbonatus]